MKKPKAFSAREFVDSMSYIGEYYQPDDSVYRKESMDKYIEYLENLISKSNRTKARSCNNPVIGKI